LQMGNLKNLESKYIINTYNRNADLTPLLVKGEGSWVWDEQGRKYLDFLSGLAVNVVGHCHPEVVRAIGEQAARLIHTSNLYYSEPQIELARVLVENSLPGGKVFFANSGAEANEAAIKLARKKDPGRYKIVTAYNSFHGRTMATLSATGQPKYHQAFQPIVEGFSYAHFNDLGSFEELIDNQTAAVLIEPIQGEGGVHVAEESFLKGLRELCDRSGILLIYDEVQCGMGRTGKLWSFENWGVSPDLFTVAKGLGGGLPIGALIVSDPYTALLQPGEHASTFGGNQVVCSAARAVFKILKEDGFMEQVQKKGLMVKEALKKAVSDYPNLVKDYRGVGLIYALELSEPAAKQIQGRCTEEGLLINAIGDNILRFLPPLTISENELKDGLKILNSLLTEHSTKN